MVDAKAVKERAAKKSSGSRARNTSHIPAHKHCRMCGIDIDLKADPRICKDEECVKKLEKQDKNDRLMRIMFFIFFLAIIAPVLLQLLGFGG